MNTLRILLALALPVLLWAQPAAESATDRLEITLERLEDGEWRVVDPGLVLDNGDRIRFRFRADFDGYLYVMNQGTSGQYELLFPREETGQNNRVEAGQEYQVPATSAWFRVDGPPGQDIVYWLVTPLTLGAAPKYVPLPPPPAQKIPPASLLPRCDDAIFRARGICVDSSAGPREVRPETELPENLSTIPGIRSRELIIMRKEEGAVVSSPADRQGPLLYEFRLAHK